MLPKCRLALLVEGMNDAHAGPGVAIEEGALPGDHQSRPIAQNKLPD